MQQTQTLLSFSLYGQGTRNSITEILFFPFFSFPFLSFPLISRDAEEKEHGTRKARVFVSVRDRRETDSVCVYVYVYVRNKKGVSRYPHA